jgi:DNA primase
VISEYVPLRPAGSRLKGLCPFHQEKTPSFSVDPKQQLFYCFGCQTGGDLFKFVMLYERVGFTEALEQLAHRFGIPLPSTAQREDDGTERLLRLNQTAQLYFQARLRDTDGPSRGRDYLAQRGLDETTVERLALGYAPETWDALRNHLAGKRFTADEMLRAGLVLPRKTGAGEYDRFRDRLIFPIRDLLGRTIGFGGRSVGDGTPKYINSPDTPVYTKGEHLYGLDQAREAIRHEGFAIVVEGYLDLAAVVQAGIHNVVATLGTAFTPAQSRLLARFTQRVVFSYDGDAAGASATERPLGLLLERGFDVRVAELPDAQDPDDYIRDHGGGAYVQVVRNAPAYIEFLIHREARSRDLTRLDERVAAVNALLPHLARVANAIERASWAERLADVLHIDNQLVLQELRTAIRSARPTMRQRPADATQPLRDAEARLVLCLLRSEDERRRWVGHIDPVDLEESAVERIVTKILGLAAADRPADVPTLLAELDDDADRELLTRIAFRDEPEEGPGVEDCLVPFRRRRLARERSSLRREIEPRPEPGAPAANPDDLNRNLERLQQLARQRDQLH